MADIRPQIKLSVIIPTRDRSGLLAKALRSLQYQTLPAEQFEVLVVDNGSADDTRSIAGEAIIKSKNARYLFCQAPGLHAARHLGLKNAQYDILVFTDDDVEALPTWLEAIAAGFSRPDIAMVGGKCLPKFESDPPHWLTKRWASPCAQGKFLGFLSILDFGDAIKEISPTYVIGCNFAIRKRSLLAVGGFHPDAMPGEFAFFRGDGETWVGRAVAAQGGKALYHPEAAVYHWVPSGRMTFAYLYQRAFAEGITRSFVHLRKIHNIDESFPEDARMARSWRRRLAHGLRRTAMALPFHHPFQRIEKKGLRDGYRAHRKRFAADPGLRSWVLREDWLEDPGAKN